MQLKMIYEDNGVVPFGGTSSPKVDNLLSDCFIGYDSDVDRGVNRQPVIDLEILPGNVSECEQGSISKYIFPNTMQNNEGRVPCRSDGGSDKETNDSIDGCWLEKCMCFYGITDLDTNDIFNMKNVGFTPQPRESSSAAGALLESKKEMKKNETSNGNVHSSSVMVLRGATCRKSNNELQANCGRECATKWNGFSGISERKREQNRYAAIRYRDKRREEAKQKREQLHALELRNVELKTEFHWLEKEVAYLKNLMKLTRGS